MDLSRIAIDPRLRSSWEAIDLGCVMARRWYLPLLLCWCIPCLLLIVVIGVLLSNHWWLGLLLVWWCKPLCDQLPLYFLSRALFNDPVSVRQSWGHLPALWRIDGFARLTWRRFSATRSFDLPVTQLERLFGNQRNQRLQVLHRRNTGAALWLTLVCLHLELLVVFGVLALVFWFLPRQADVELFQMLRAGDTAAHWLNFALVWLSMSLIAPFYVAAGFALYISRRIELEAWDVEIRFRHLATQQNPSPANTLSPGQKPGRTPSQAFSSATSQASVQHRQKTHLTITIFALLSIFALFGIYPEYANASQQASTAEYSAGYTTEIISTSEQSKQLMNEVLAGEDFHVMEKVTRWRMKPISTDAGEGLPQWFITAIKWLEAVLLQASEKESLIDHATLALILEIFLWCGAALAAGALLYIYRQDLQGLLASFKEKNSEADHKPQVLFGLDVSKDSLPNDIPQQVNQLCEQGHFRQALSLLYRATLSGLMHHRRFTFYDSYTEGECVRLVQHSDDYPLSQFTEDLTHCWQRLAYGHQTPTREDVDQLCRRWREFFSDDT